MKVDIYSQDGNKTGTTDLPKEIFGLDWNDDLVHQVVVSMQANKRIPWANAKGRAEVSGGGKKPWKQKGTGRARHGSSRSPIWVGGGVTHGPLKERDFSKKLNKKMKKKALFVVLSRKLKDGELLILDDLKITEPKAKEANKIILNLAGVAGFESLKSKTKKNNRAAVLVTKKEENLKRAFSNLPGIMLDEAKNLNAVSALTYKCLIFPKDAIKAMTKAAV